MARLGYIEEAMAQLELHNELIPNSTDLFVGEEGMLKRPS
jgi:hypothetical protein